MFVIAHAGHWFVGILEAAPVLVLGGWLALATLKERRRERRERKAPR